MENYLDDRVIIPDYIKNMTHEERLREIERLENEHKLKAAKEKKNSIAFHESVI